MRSHRRHLLLVSGLLFACACVDARAEGVVEGGGQEGPVVLDGRTLRHTLLDFVLELPEGMSFEGTTSRGTVLRFRLDDGSERRRVTATVLEGRDWVDRIDVPDGERPMWAVAVAAAANQCAADGPEESRFCTGVASEREFEAWNGAPIREFTLELVHVHSGASTVTRWATAPFLWRGLWSGPGGDRGLLVFASPHDTLSVPAADALRSLVSSLRPADPPSGKGWEDWAPRFVLATLPAVVRAKPTTRAGEVFRLEAEAILEPDEWCESGPVGAEAVVPWCRITVDGEDGWVPMSVMAGLVKTAWDGSLRIFLHRGIGGRAGYDYFVVGRDGAVRRRWTSDEPLSFSDGAAFYASQTRDGRELQVRETVTGRLVHRDPTWASSDEGWRWAGDDLRYHFMPEWRGGPDPEPTETTWTPPHQPRPDERALVVGEYVTADSEPFMGPGSPGEVLAEPAQGDLITLNGAVELGLFSYGDAGVSYGPFYGTTVDGDTAWIAGHALGFFREENRTEGIQVYRRRTGHAVEYRVRSADSGRMGEAIRLPDGVDERSLRFSFTKRWYLVDVRDGVAGPFAVFESFSGEEIFRDDVVGGEIHWRRDRLSYGRPTDRAGPHYIFEWAEFSPEG